MVQHHLLHSHHHLYEKKKKETEYGVVDESGEEVNDSKFTWTDHWKDGWMKMATCNVHIMDGHLMGVAPKFLRLCLKALKLVQSSLQELILPDFLQWCPKVTGRKDRAKSFPFKVESGLVVSGALLEPMMGTHRSLLSLLRLVTI